jgi:RNA polymerase sigma-70 factor (ECF subfamily)
VPRPEDASEAPRADDERLLAAVAEGDREALGRLYDRFAPSMLAVGQRILGGARDAEDLVHDVFLEAWQRACHYEPARGSVRTWLMLRLRSRALDRLRSRRRTSTSDLDSPAARQLAHAPEEEVASDAQLVTGWLAELPRDHRVVLELGYFEGCSCAEIATRLRVPIGTVKSRMSRALSQLRSRAQPAPGGES